MNGHGKINIFDFDSTLIRTVGPEAFRLVKKYIETNDCAHLKLKDLPFTEDEVLKNRILWWDNKISLDPILFSFPVIKPVFDAYMRDKDNPNVLNIVISHRSTNLTPYIQHALETKGISMDKIYAIDRKIKKFYVLSNILKDYEKVKTIHIFEDAVSAINGYIEYFENRKHDYKIKVFLINTAYTYTLEGRVEVRSAEENLLI